MTIIQHIIIKFEEKLRKDSTMNTLNYKHFLPWEKDNLEKLLQKYNNEIKYLLVSARSGSNIKEMFTMMNQMFPHLNCQHS